MNGAADRGGKSDHSEQRRYPSKPLGIEPLPDVVVLLSDHQRRDYTKGQAGNETENIIDLLDISCYAYPVCVSVDVSKSKQTLLVQKR